MEENESGSPYGQKEYMYYESTTSICHLCEKVVQGKIVFKEGKTYLIKYCPEHGELWSLLERSETYHRRKKTYDKPGTTMKVHKKVEKGCPYDCGICPQHEQHGCIGLIEVTRRCDLACPLCYADGGDGDFLSLEEIERMIDFYLESEGGAGEILQISGGEPTLHPQILEIIRLAKSKPLKYVMLNTNGLRIAEDLDFVRALSEFGDQRFEIYLQFDGLKEDHHQTLRGKPLLEIKRKAIKNLSDFKIPITFVSTVERGVNEDDVGELFIYALNQPYVRGINFQPAAYFGRREMERTEDRVTLSDIMLKLEETTNGILKESDFIPLPCNVDRVAITYLYRDRDGSFIPITRDKKIQNHVSLINNTFVFTVEDLLKNAGKNMGSILGSCDCLQFLKDFRKMIPLDYFSKSKEKKKEYIDLNTFRISITSFVDLFNFDHRSMQKECVHVITKDLRKIPFSAYNMIYREKEGK